ncbi:hypothetical protein B0O80DRAFT_171016 [Mortierella sp. GBAus27b]|nr:hypothetical protein B0O80DRAFT_171016 [Mortierella sp. GBAus27b]
MSADTNAQPMQEFRSRSTDEVLEIATYLDPGTGNHVVLWEDIKAGFKNADSIRNGRSLVPFLKDANLKEIIPRRIAYYPGTVLDIILNSGHSHSHSHSHSHGYNLCHGHSQLYPQVTLPHSWEIYQPTVTPERTPPAAITFMHSDTDNSSLAMYPTTTGEISSSSLTLPSPLHNTLIHNALSAQVTMQQFMQLSMNQQFDGLRVEMHKNRELQEQLLQLQLLQQQTSDLLVKNQEEMKEMQKVSLDRLAIIQSRVQAVVTQTYELHEYPIPRLFIVLPKSTGVFDKIKNPFVNHFRLYFLCECGSHTMSENSKTQHEIHFAKHEGYDLEKPNEFFERYGSYILTLMNMIKYGVTAAGLVVSPLSGLKIVEGIDTAQQHMDYLKKNLTPLVDSSINFLEGIKHKNDLGKNVAEDHEEFDQLQALEGADLRQLESYLKIKDKGRVLANLYRIVTFEGHVKWVCFDHYKATYRASAVQHLREIVEVNRGTFIEETGTIEIKVAISTLAKQFYDAMVKARGIQELDITLEWDATMSDIRSLVSAISKANVVHVTMNGSHFKSSLLDVVNRSQRFNPILQLTSNSRIQSLRLCGFDGFFSRITKSSLGPAPNLRVFKYDVPPTSKDSDLQTVDDFLGRCSALTTLELSLHPHQSITKTMSEMLRKVPTLESLKIGREELSVIVGLSNGKIKDVDLTIRQLGELDHSDLKPIQKEHLSRLSIMNVPRDGANQLGELLRAALSLKHLRIGCDYQDSLVVIDSVISTREKIVQDTGSSCLQTFELMKKGLIPFSTLSYENHIQSHISFQDSPNLFDMRTWIHHGGDSAQKFVRRYGWSIGFYNGRFQPHVSFSDILNGLDDTKTPRLESLWIQPRQVDTDVVDDIIRRSPNFKDLGLYVDLDDKDDFIAAQTLLGRHSRILSFLSLKDRQDSKRWEWFASSFPTRDTLPALESFISIALILHQTTSHGLWPWSRLLFNNSSHLRSLPFRMSLIAKSPTSSRWHNDH